jgi:hypothetical protein
MMSKEDVMADFRIALQLPGVEKSGNILAEELKRRATRYVDRDRTGLVGAVKDWLEARDDLLTVQAAVLIREFKLDELKDSMRRIRNEVAAGAFLKPTSVWIFDRALESLDD